MRVLKIKFLSTQYLRNTQYLHQFSSNAIPRFFSRIYIYVTKVKANFRKAPTFIALFLFSELPNDVLHLIILGQSNYVVKIIIARCIATVSILHWWGINWHLNKRWDSHPSCLFDLNHNICVPWLHANIGHWLWAVCGHYLLILIWDCRNTQAEIQYTR